MDAATNIREEGAVTLASCSADCGPILAAGGRVRFLRTMAHSNSKSLVASDTSANQIREALTLYEVESLPRRYLGHRTAVRARPGA